MKIQLKKLILVNFKGAKSVEIDFADVTNISGRNATGKSTVFDSFTWLLFGKNANDQKDFSVKTWDENGKIIEKIDHEVTGFLILDGVETKLTRTLKEKWTKKRGEETPEFTGNETLYFINDVPKSQAEYQNFISGIIPESTFKLLTSPGFFNSLKWTDRREMLISIAGAPTNEEIAGNDLISLLALMQTEKKTIEDLKKEYSVKKKKLNEALEQIPTRIDENNRDTPEAKDFLKIEGDLNRSKHSLELVEAEILDKSKGVQDAIRERSEKLVEKSNLETRIQRIEFEAKNQFANAGNAKDSEIRNKQSSILSLKQSILNLQSDIRTNQARVDALLNANHELKLRYEKRNEEQLIWNKEYTCPTCGQGLPDDLLAHREQDATASFNKLKVNDLNAFVKQASDNKVEIERSNNYISSLNTQVLELEEKIKNIEAQIASLQNTPIHSESVESILAKNTEYADLKAKFDSIVIPEIVQADTTALQIQKVELAETIAKLEADLRIRERIAEKNKRKAEIEAEGKSLSQQIADLEKIEYQIETFNKRKINYVESMVNKLFPTVRFRMFNQLINGGFEDACDCLIAGVPYSDANTASQVNAGIEIINVFSQIHNCFAPIFIDKAEGVIQVIPTQSQLIRLIVAETFKVKASGQIVSKINGFASHEVEEYRGLLIEA